MKPNLLSLLLHPLKSLRIMKEAQISSMHYEESMKMLQQRLNEKEETCLKLSEDKARLEEKLANSEKEKEELIRKILSLEEELADRDDIDRRLLEFEKKLSGIETLKKNYEKRINALQANLVAARARIAHKENYDLLDYIDMQEEQQCEEESGTPASSISRSTPSNETGNSRTDSMSENTNGQYNREPLIVRFPDLSDEETEEPEKEGKEVKKRGYWSHKAPKEQKAPGMPEHFPESSDDDWLMKLPDNF